MTVGAGRPDFIRQQRGRERNRRVTPHERPISGAIRFFGQSSRSARRIYPPDDGPLPERRPLESSSNSSPSAASKSMGMLWHKLLFAFS